MEVGIRSNLDRLLRGGQMDRGRDRQKDGWKNRLTDGTKSILFLLSYINDNE